VKPTAYPDVNEVLDRLGTSLVRILGAELIGLYLYGSLASGDFDPNSSDIDFVAALAVKPEARVVDRLRQVHEDLQRSDPWGARLEGAYIDRVALRRHVAGEAHPFLNEDHPLSIAVLDESWVINRAQLRDMGLTISGPDPASLIDKVSGEQMQAAMHQELETWWRPLMQGSPKMQPRRYQSFAVLTMCRALFLFEHGRIASKPTAAEWAISSLGPEWRSLIERALTWRADPTADPEALARTNAFIQLVLSKRDKAGSSYFAS
jgi:predicted nucleotidyltransferase